MMASIAAGMLTVALGLEGLHDGQWSGGRGGRGMLQGYLVSPQAEINTRPHLRLTPTDPLVPWSGCLRAPWQVPLTEAAVQNAEDRFGTESRNLRAILHGDCRLRQTTLHGIMDNKVVDLDYRGQQKKGSRFFRTGCSQCCFEGLSNCPTWLDDHKAVSLDAWQRVAKSAQSASASRRAPCRSRIWVHERSIPMKAALIVMSRFR